MQQTSDQAILAIFAATHDAAAFEELVRRYSGLVYSAAVRQVRDPHVAEDITQAVFIVLARQAGSIRRDVVLASWFFTVTRHAVNNARRMDARRRYHETRKAAICMNESTSSGGASSASDDVLPLLDDAMSRLSDGERSAVFLRYFENRTHEEIGGILALSADSSRKRLERALTKMRRFLEGRGVTTSDAALGSVIAHAALVPQPAGLLNSIVNVAVLSDSIGAAQSATAAASIAKGAAHMMILSKLKPVIAACAALLVVGVAVAQTIKAPAGNTAKPQAAAPAVAAVAEKPAEFAPDAAGDFVVSVSKDVKIHLLGVAPFMGENDSWFALNGEPIKAPDTDIPPGQINAQPPPDQQILIKIEKPADVRTMVKVQDAQVVANMSAHANQKDVTLLCAFKLGAGATTAALEIGVADADWKTLVTNEKPDQPGEFDGKEYGPFSFQAIDDIDGRASVVVEHQPIHEPCEVVAVDDKGSKHRLQKVWIESNGEQDRVTYGFDLPSKSVKQLIVQVRPFSKIVDVKEISLEKGRFTKPQITVRDAKPEDGEKK